ncbi:YrbL family protein [Psychroserpens damuponensis]|uniref:YrbL family protein n=1 Tax=Psychroserpens damuponensis TaxID=943936 RepID=UPI00058FE0DD|nr:YrbL family protein [Psychroserpens damuponensis]
MIILEDKLYISEGLARVVYQHPNDSDLCVKIGKPEVDVKHLYKEIIYYNKIKRKDVSKFEYPFYAKYHGEIETNKGVGFVYDLIKDEESQQTSKVLRQYLEMKPSPISDNVFLKELNRLKQQMITHKVFASDLRARNICCKRFKDGSVRLIIVDGIGHRDFLPFADYLGYFAKKKNERRFEKAKLVSLDEQRDYIKALRDRGDVIV